MPTESDYERYKLRDRESIKNYYDAKALFEKRVEQVTKIRLNHTIETPERKTSIMEQFKKDLVEIKAICQATQEAILELMQKVDSSPLKIGHRLTEAAKAKGRAKAQENYRQKALKRQRMIKEILLSTPVEDINILGLRKLLKVGENAVRKDLKALGIELVSSRKRHSLDKKDEVIAMFKAGKPTEEIAYKLGIKYGTVKNWIRSHRKDKSNASNGI